MGKNHPFLLNVDSGLEARYEGFPQLVERCVDSTFCIEPTFWCKGVCAKEYIVLLLTSDLLECVEGFEAVGGAVKIEFA